MDPELEKIRKEVHKRSLHISETHQETKAYFKRLAEELFKDDYGDTLTYLCGIHRAVHGNPDEEVNAKIDVLAEEIGNIRSAMRQEKSKPKGRKIRMVNGNEIHVPD